MSGSQSRTVAELVETARARVIQIGLVYQPRLPSRPSEPIAVSQTRQAGPRRIASDAQRQRQGQSPQVIASAPSAVGRRPGVLIRSPQ